MILKNILYFNSEFKPVRGDIHITGGTISALTAPSAGSSSLPEGAFVSPGLMDIHLHGCMGASASSALSSDIDRMSDFLAAHGITGFVPAIITDSAENQRRQVAAIAHAHPAGAQLLGIRAEGSFLSPVRPGCHDISLLRNPDCAEFDALCAAADKKLCIVDVAPELPGAAEFIRHAAAAGVVVSAAHSDADYDTALAAYEAGAADTTHLFNAMSPLSHRAPGMVTAAFDSPKAPFAEMICDGFHIHPAVIRISAQLLGRNRLIYISDSMEATGLSDGDYTIGNRLVCVRNAQARTPEGVIAGSTVTVADCYRRAVSFGVDPETALRAVTINPARLLGLNDRLGSIEVGKQANLTVFDAQYRVLQTVLSGISYEPVSAK